MNIRERLLGGFTVFAPKKVAPTKTGGGAGTAVIGGYVVDGEKSPSLAGRQKYVTYNNNLANVAIVAASVRAFLNTLAKAKWTVEAPVESDAEEPSEEAVEKAKLIEEMMSDMDTPWHRIVKRQALFKFHGFTIQEWIAKRRDDGLIGMRDVESRPQHTIERWDVDISGTVKGVGQRIPFDMSEVYLPRTKIIYSVEDSLSDSPEGLGLFRHVVESVNRLREYHDLELLGYQTDLRGIPIARAPVTEIAAAEAEGGEDEGHVTRTLANILGFIKNHMRNRSSGILLDSEIYRASGETGTASTTPKWGLELLSSESGSTAEIAAAIQRLVREIAIVLGTDHLLTGSDGTGSLALSKDKTENFLLTINSTLSDLAEDFTHDWIDPIWRLNGWDDAIRPKFRVEEISNRDAAALATILREISAAGVDIRGDDELVTEFFNMIGLTPPERDEEDYNDPLLGGLNIDPLTGLPVPPTEVDPKTGASVEVEEEEPPQPKKKTPLRKYRSVRDRRVK